MHQLTARAADRARAMLAHARRPWVAWPAAAAACLAAALAYFAPGLGDRFFLFGTDTYSHDYVMHLYGWGTIRQTGRIPLWCPYMFSGFPFVASFALCPFYPTQFLYAWLPHNTAFTLQYALGMAAGGFLFAVWMRVLGTRLAVAAWCGFCFMFSGHFVTLAYAGHLQKLIAIAWAPLAFAATHAMLRCPDAPHVDTRRLYARRLLCAAFLALAVCMQALASHLQILYATVSWCCLHAAAVIWMRRRQSRRGGTPLCRRSMRATAISFAAALAAGLLAAGPQLLPGWEMSRVSNRAAGVSFEEAAATSYPPVELLEFAVPRIFGDSVIGSSPPYFGRWGQRIVSDYLGAPLLLLAAAGMILSRRRIRWFLLAALGASLLAGLGRYTLVYRMLYACLPGFASFRSPGTFMFVASLCVIALAGLGIEALACGAWAGAARRVRLGRRTAAWIEIVAGTAVAAGLLLALVAAWSGRGVVVEIATPEELARHHVWRRLTIAGLESFAAGALAMACARWSARPRRRMAAAAALAVLAVALPLAHNRHFIVFQPLAQFADYLRQEGYAVLANVKERPVRALEERALRVGNILHGVGSPTGYHPVVPGRYERLMQLLGYTSDSFGRLFAVNYAHMVSDFHPPGEWDLLRRMQDASLWRRRSPAAYAKTEVNLLTALSPRQEEQLLTAGVFDPDDTAIMDEAVAGAAGVKAGKQFATAELIDWGASSIRLKAHARRTGVVPLAEVYAPGWKAFTDSGDPVALVPVNMAQRGLVVPKGAHLVAMTYEPFSYRLGVFLGMLVVTVAVASFWGVFVRRSLDAVTALVLRHGKKGEAE